MKGILKLYSQYGDKIIIIPVLCIILCMVTYFIHIITKKSRFPKYLPGLAFIIFGIFKFKSGWKNLVYSSGLQDLWIFTLVFTSGFVAICFALIASDTRSPSRYFLSSRKILTLRGGGWGLSPVLPALCSLFLTSLFMLANNRC